MATGKGGADNTKYANRKKSGSTDRKSFDPATTGGMAGGGGTKLSKMYSPEGGRPSVPGTNRGKSS